MGKFSDAARETAKNVERIADAMESIPSAGSFSGPGGSGGGGGAGGSTPTVFNNTIIVPQPSRTTNTPIGTRGDDIQSRAFAYYGLSAANKSDVFIRQIIAAFERMLKSGLGMGLRMGSGG
jgi:hypothetical protein